MLRAAVAEKKIEYIIHFTRLCNLENILLNGIVPRQVLEENGTAFSYNDQYRLDNRKNYSCFSITHPNYKMFYPCRLQTPSIDWVVIRLSPEIIHTKQVLFCSTNAACSSQSSKPDVLLSGPVAFNSLFIDQPNFPSRVDLALIDNEPTDVQSELLISDVVEPSAIIDVLFDDRNRIKDYDSILNLAKRNSGFKFFHGKDYFYPRHDYSRLNRRN